MATIAQCRALRLIKSGGYFYQENGSVRHRNHVPGRTAVIYRQTMVALVNAGLARWSDSYYGLAELTEAGKLALGQGES